jgi:hypothetical protein
MLAVGFDIGQVVEDINSAGDKAKQEESRNRPRERDELEQLLVEDQREKHKAVLRPLARAHGFEQGNEHGVDYKG